MSAGHLLLQVNGICYISQPRKLKEWVIGHPCLSSTSSCMNGFSVCENDDFNSFK